MISQAAYNSTLAFTSCLREAHRSIRNSSLGSYQIFLEHRSDPVHVHFISPQMGKAEFIFFVSPSENYQVKAHNNSILRTRSILVSWQQQVMPELQTACQNCKMSLELLMLPEHCQYLTSLTSPWKSSICRMLLLFDLILDHRHIEVWWMLGR